MQMEMFMKETGKMTKLMDLEDTCTQMEQPMRAIGKKTSNMERGKRPGLMGHVMKETM